MPDFKSGNFILEMQHFSIREVNTEVRRVGVIAMEVNDQERAACFHGGVDISERRMVLCFLLFNKSLEIFWKRPCFEISFET